MSHEWMDRAACLGSDAELFHPIGNTGTAKEQVTYARENYCDPCGVSAECLAFALRNHINEGAWGGLTGPDRELLKRRNSRARAKAAPAKKPTPPVQRGPRALVDAGPARRLIADSGLPNERVAARCGLDKDTVWRIRSGARDQVTRGTLARLERGLAGVGA